MTLAAQASGGRLPVPDGTQVARRAARTGAEETARGSKPNRTLVPPTYVAVARSALLARCLFTDAQMLTAMQMTPTTSPEASDRTMIITLR